MGDKPASSLKSFIRTLTGIHEDEVNAAFLSFTFIFLLMFAYNILKPVRDALAPEWSDVELAYLWTINFVCAAIAVSIYGAVVSRLKLRNAIPGVYAFFAASFVLFYIVAQNNDTAGWVNKAFYVWISVFSLFHVSVFWSLMSDLFSQKQAPRLFAFIASGASIGTLAGSAVTLVVAKMLGTLNLMLVAASILVLIVPLITILRSTISEGTGIDDGQKPISSNPFAGFSRLVRNPYLLGIALFIFLYTFIGSFVYFELKNLMSVNDRDTNTAIWAGINLTVNSISIFTAMFVTSRFAQRFGVGKTLAIVPLLVAVGLLAVFVSPILLVTIGAWVTLKAGNYAITRPGREMLYTRVDREDRFKTKQVIDIVVYRGGDVVSSWAFAYLTASLGLGMGPIALLGAVVAIIWAYVGLRLGNTYDRDSQAALSSDGEGQTT